MHPQLIHVQIYNPKIEQSTSTGCIYHIMQVDQVKQQTHQIIELKQEITHFHLEKVNKKNRATNKNKKQYISNPSLI